MSFKCIAKYICLLLSMCLNMNGVFGEDIRPPGYTYEPKDGEVGFSTIDPFFSFPISNSPAHEECNCRDLNPPLNDPLEILQLGSTFGGCWPMGLALKRFSSHINTYIYIYPSIYTLLVWQEDFIIYSYELWYYILRKYEWILGCTLLLLRRK